MPAVLLAIATGLVAIADWVAVTVRRKDLETVLKPATLALMTATVVAAGALDSRAGMWLVVALVFGMLGDIALLADSDRRFLMGLAAFLVGHLAYVACFLVIGVTASWWLAAGIAAVLVAVVVGRDVVPSAARSELPGLVYAVAAYMGVIGAMTVSGFATASPWIAIGAAIFVCSDTTLALDRFVQRRSWSQPVVMVTYHVGQALMAVGVLVELDLIG